MSKLGVKALGVLILDGYKGGKSKLGLMDKVAS